MNLKTRLFGRTYQFKDIKEVLAKANEEKSGDRLAGIIAESMEERIAAKHVLANLKDLVVKEVHGAGGYGMLIGPAATRAEIEAFRAALIANPAGYIAQPTLSLSTCPTYVDAGIAPRHIDLRPFVLSGQKVQMVAGGLTRVALKEGSLVVNSSQGGGTKDTWVLGDEDGGQ